MKTCPYHTHDENCDGEPKGSPYGLCNRKVLRGGKSFTPSMHEIIEATLPRQAEQPLDKLPWWAKAE